MKTKRNGWKRTTAAWILAVAGSLSSIATAAELPAGLRAEAEAAAAKGAAWLAAQQQFDGYWGMPDAPAMSALAMWALQSTDAKTYQTAIDRALVFVLTNVKENGAIFRPAAPGRRGGGLANYNTSVCLSALHSLSRPELVPVILKARSYIAGTQYLEPGLVRGGMGYDPAQPRPYADLSNSAMAYEAMRRTEDVEDLRAPGDEKADLDWAATREFLAQVQNLPSVNTNSWVSDDDTDRGGFMYTPGRGPAGGGGGPNSGRGGPGMGAGGRGMGGAGANGVGRPEGLPPSQARLPEGEHGTGLPGDAAPSAPDAPVKLRSYGSMTYAGLLSLIYADVDRSDARVAAAQEWALSHWTLDENPGQGPEGLYYFFNILTKCLKAFGDDVLTLPDGRTVVWREEVIRKILSLQQPDGFWVNENNRWWEADPNLVTSYTLLALAAAME